MTAPLGTVAATASAPEKASARAGKPSLSLNLFWRTYALLALMLTVVIVTWVQTLAQIAMEPEADQAGRQLATLVTLSTAALGHAEPAHRQAVIKTLLEQESAQVLLRSPKDQWEPLELDRYTRAVAGALRKRLGNELLLARQVNGQAGVWVGFNLGQETYWLQADATRLQGAASEQRWAWLLGALLVTALGSALAAALINRPLEDLSFAASRLGDGEYDSRLDESNITPEIRTVNIGFNRMARELAKVEEERAVMLAGISHDLRTPLARLRLEAEISVFDEEARRHMASDIDQLDAIIDKFMDYARPDDTNTVPVDVGVIVEHEAATFRNRHQMQFSIRLPPGLKVMADATELTRIFANLFENARRYGRTAETGITKVKVSHVVTAGTVIITVRDYGPGVAPDKLEHLTTPFFRGDAARTAATGAGLGLAIVKKALQRIGGSLELANARDSGLMAHIRLKLP